MFPRAEWCGFQVIAQFYLDWWYNPGMDARLRRLERMAQTGDPEAIDALEQERYRLLPIPQDHLELLAHLGFDAAQNRMGWKLNEQQAAKLEPYQVQVQPVFKDPNGLTKRAVTTVRELQDLMDRWQKATNVRIALYACEAAEPKFTREMKTPYLREVCEAVRAWLDDQSHENAKRCSDLAEQHYEHPPDEVSAAEILGSAIGEAGVVGMPGAHIVRQNCSGAAYLARAIYADMTVGHHDLPAHIQVAHVAGSACEFAAAVESDQVVCAAILKRMRTWVIEQAMKDGAVYGS